MSTILPFLLPIDTLSDEELLEHGTFLDSLPGDVRELIAGMKTDEAIRESIAQRYSLNESQFRHSSICYGGRTTKRCSNT